MNTAIFVNNLGFHSDFLLLRIVVNACNLLNGFKQGRKEVDAFFPQGMAVLQVVGR